jgi:hypothetical protein
MRECVTEYESRLVEAAVLLALRGHAEEPGFRAERDPLYGILDSEAREAAFRAFHAAWFERLGLDREVARALRERPSIALRADRCLLAHTSSGRDESAELFVAPGNGEGKSCRGTVVLRLRPETLARPAGLREFLRHEFLHIADMLDPRFAYEPWLPPSEAGPAHEPLLKDRYRVLWDAYIDGRLSRLGQAPAGRRAERLGEFKRAFPMLGHVTEEAFDRFFTAVFLRHDDLVAFAVDPESILSRSSGGRSPGDSCPLCRFPTYAFEPEAGRLPSAVLEEIRGDFPGWDPARGLCLQCADLYRSRALA